jgi:hypothetical protein
VKKKERRGENETIKDESVPILALLVEAAGKRA